MYEYIDEYGEKQQTGLKLKLKDEKIKSDAQIIEVSEKVFNTLFPERNIKQVCVYIEDYAYMDDVMSELTAKGYNNFSVFRVGAKEYDKETVMAKLQIIGISLAASVAIFFVGILIIHMMMKLKKKDFIVYDCLGMDHRIRYRIIKTDLIVNAVLSCVLVMIIAFVLNMKDVEIIVNIVKYYRWYSYLLLYIIAVAMAYLTSRVFNKYLNKVCK